MFLFPFCYLILLIGILYKVDPDPKRQKKRAPELIKRRSYAKFYCINEKVNLKHLRVMISNIKLVLKLICPKLTHYYNFKKFFNQTNLRLQI